MKWKKQVLILDEPITIESGYYSIHIENDVGFVIKLLVDNKGNIHPNGWMSVKGVKPNEA